MSQNKQTEKQIIDTLRKISIPGPDPDFEHDLRMQFVKRAQAKRTTAKIRRRLTWIGSIAVVAMLVLLIVKGDFLQPVQEISSSTNSEGTAMPSNRGVEQPHAAEESLFEIYNYPAGNPWDWRFYRNENYNKIYAATADNEAQLLYAAAEGYVNAHIYPHPNVPNNYILVLIKGKEGESENYQFYEMNNEASLTSFPDSPEGDYDAVQLQWSPNGERAFLHMLNTTLMKSAVGILDPVQDTFMLIHGGPMTEPGDPSNAERAYASVATWLDDRYILLYNHLFNQDTYTFRKLDAEMRESSVTAFAPPTDPFHVLELHSVGQEQLVVLKAGNMRLDVGFEPSYRLYLVDINASADYRASFLTPLAPDAILVEGEFEQDYLGMTADGNIIVSDIFDGEEYGLSLRILDPVHNEVIWKHESTFPRVIANPTGVFSPNKSKLAIRFYSEETSTNEYGNTTYRPAPYVFVVLDLANEKVLLSTESDSYDFPEWTDDNVLSIGLEIFDFSKSN